LGVESVEAASRMKIVRSIKINFDMPIGPARKIFESANDIELLGCGSCDIVPRSAITLFFE
jgi:hypothetical protein